MRLPSYKYFLALNDLLISIFSFFVARALVLKLKSGLIILSFPNFFGISYLFLFWSIFFSFLMVFIFQNNNLYKINLFLTKSAQLTAILKSILFGSIIIIIISFFFKLTYIIDSRELVIAYLLIFSINISIIRIFVLSKLYQKITDNKHLRKNAVIIGAGEIGKMIAAKIMFEEIHGLELIGFVDDGIPKNNIISGVNNLGSSSELKEIKDKYKVDEFIIAINNISYERLLELIDQCNNTGAISRLHSNLFKIIPQKTYTESYSDIKVIEVSQRFNTRANMFFKRIVDLFFTSIGLLILSPFLIVIALIIRFTSKGPVIFTQLRVGKNGKVFKFYKFRTMYVNNGEDIERKEKMINFMKNNNHGSNTDTKVVREENITKIGKLLRKTSLDELPQLFNVLKGDMSLVGPRPCLIYEYENYDAWQKRRLNVTPGCTGLWQVAGRSSVSFNDSVVLDLYYINNMSPWLDLQLIIKTIPVMVFGKGGK